MSPEAAEKVIDIYLESLLETWWKKPLSLRRMAKQRNQKDIWRQTSLLYLYLKRWILVRNSYLSMVGAVIIGMVWHSRNPFQKQEKESSKNERRKGKRKHTLYFLKRKKRKRRKGRFLRIERNPDFELPLFCFRECADLWIWRKLEISNFTCPTKRSFLWKLMPCHQLQFPINSNIELILRVRERRWLEWIREWLRSYRL